MAVGAIQTRLVDKSLRCDANIIVETASARDPHHFAVLLGFGATAIYPYWPTKRWRVSWIPVLSTKITAR